MGPMAEPACHSLYRTHQPVLKRMTAMAYCKRYSIFRIRTNPMVDTEFCNCLPPHRGLIGGSLSSCVVNAHNRLVNSGMKSYKRGSDWRQSRNQQLLRSLRESIVDKPPYISGTLQLPESFFSLFYKVAIDITSISMTADLSPRKTPSRSISFPRNCRMKKDSMKPSKRYLRTQNSWQRAARLHLG